MPREVTMIPQTINPLTRIPKTAVTKRRVAAYARVSTDSEEQLTSYEAQIDYYTNYINRNQEWEFVKVYTDEGISATNTKHRDGFNQMVADALAGRIDLIVTKSVSRFARNTVDSLTTVRELKAHGVEVYFEKENIYTFDGKGELLITIMSSLAQEESRSISENVTWGQRKRFADGKVSLPYKQFLGYKKGEDGLPEIVPEEAVIVRRIYSLFMGGKTDSTIANILTAEGIPTPSGKDVWRKSTIQSILTNEKYKGSAILQKCFTVDFLTKKMKVNEGEVPQYYVEHSHEAIIPPDEWEAVQAEIERRKSLGKLYSGQSVFATRIVCEDCGSFYGQKVWHSNSKYRRSIWRCNHKFNGTQQCSTPTLDETDIKNRFIKVFNSTLKHKKKIIANCLEAKKLIADCTEINARIEDLEQELTVVGEMIKSAITENATTAQNQDTYIQRYDALSQRFERLKEQLGEAKHIRSNKMRKAECFDKFILTLKQSETILMEFDDHLWLTVIDKVIAHRDGRLTFKFQDGREVDG